MSTVNIFLPHLGGWLTTNQALWVWEALPLRCMQNRFQLESQVDYKVQKAPRHFLHFCTFAFLRESSVTRNSIENNCGMSQLKTIQYLKLSRQVRYRLFGTKDSPAFLHFVLDRATDNDFIKHIFAALTDWSTDHYSLAHKRTWSNRFE